MMTRDERQLIGLNKWKAAQGIGTLQWVTGMGKTYATCTLFKLMLAKTPDLAIFVLVPRDELVGQWKNTIEKFGLTNKQIIVMTVQYYQYHNLKIYAGLLVIDELQEFYSDERSKIITKESIDYKFCLALSATPYDHQDRHTKYLEILPIVDIITEEEAITNNWVSDYYEFCLGIDLTDEEKTAYADYTKIMADYFKTYGDLGLAIKCASGDGFDKPFAVCCKVAYSRGWKPGLDLTIPENQDIENIFNPSVVAKKSKELLSIRRKREIIYHHAENKFKAIINLIDKFPNRKIICFSQSIPFAEKLASLINERNSNLFNEHNEECVVYHSKMDTRKLPSTKTGNLIKFGADKLRKRAVERIKTGQSRIISSAEALDTGFDVVDIGLGIISSHTRAKNKIIQRGGRVKRKNGNDRVLIINLYCKTTSEESILKELRPTNVFWVSSINQITNEGFKPTFSI